MGYASTLPYSLAELSTQLESNMAFTTVGSKHTINTITTPEFRFPLSYAYLDVFFQGYENTFAGANRFLNTSYTGLTSGGVDRHAANFDNVMVTAAAGIVRQTIVIPGYINLASYLSESTTYDCFFFGETLANGITCFDSYAKLRLYFNV